MKELLFAKSHEWAEIDGDEAKIGISGYAADELGDIVYVELPEVGDILTAGKAFANVESVKAVSEIYSPVSGEVIAVNDEVNDAPESINDAAEEAWLIKVTVTDRADGLLTKDEYLKTL